MTPKYRIENAVLIGSNRELYLAAGAHNILKYATGELTISAESVKNFWWNLRDRISHCQRNKIDFCQFVAPEKYKVYGEDFPVPNPKSFWDAHIASPEAIDNEYIWYGADDLRNNPYGRSYYKTDTHWTAAGMMLATMKIAETSAFTEQEKAALDEKMKEQTVQLDHVFYGDLGRKLVPKVGEEPFWPRRAASVQTGENGLGHDFKSPINDGRIVASFNPESVTDKTLLIFGDSYLFNALPYIELAFRKVVFCRTRFFHREIVTMVQPDTIICQAAERYTRVVSTDQNAPPYLLLPYVLGRPPNMTPEEAMFLSRMLNNNRQVSFSMFGIEE